jgi:hypothetical protein
VSLPSLRICLRLALYVGSLYGDVIGLMLLPPSQARLLPLLHRVLWFVPAPTFSL